MGMIVKLSRRPQLIRATSYDPDIEKAIRMGKDEAYRVDVPEGKDVKNIALAISQSIKRKGWNDELHVSRTGDEVYILHGPMRTVCKKTK
jgi:hypothetical protein